MFLLNGCPIAASSSHIVHNVTKWVIKSPFSGQCWSCNLLLRSTDTILDQFWKWPSRSFQISCAVSLEWIFINSESGMELAICCLAMASPCFHSFSSFFYSFSNNFSASDSNPSLAEDGIGSAGDFEVPSIFSVNPWVSTDQRNRSLKIMLNKIQTIAIFIFYFFSSYSIIHDW